MPFQIGSVAVHDDGQHTGSAKRDAANGLTALDVSGNVYGLGGMIFLTRDINNDIRIGDRTSGDYGLLIRRTAANTFELYNNSVASGKLLQDATMKNVASGIAGLDASSLLALTQQRLNFKIGSITRDTSAVDGAVAETGVGFQPRLVIFWAGVNTTAEISLGWGDGVTQNSQYGNSGGTPGAWGDIGSAIRLQQTAAIYTVGDITALGADGFTITWAKTGAKTGTAHIYYIAIR